MRIPKLAFWSLGDPEGLPTPPQLPKGASQEQRKRAEWDHQTSWDVVERGLERAEYVKAHSTPTRKLDPASWLKPVVKK
jgi:hypothetical protein